MTTISRVMDGRRILALAAFAVFLAFAFLVLMPLDPAAASCKPPGIPEYAGKGLPGMIDPATSGPSGGNYYGQYGWSGLKWYTCDTQSGLTGASQDFIAMFDTWVGNGLMGLAVMLGALMTSLHKWTADPSASLKPIDDKIVELSDITRSVLFDDWIFPVIIIAAAGILMVVFTKRIRSALTTFAVVLLSLGFVAVVAQAPLAIAQSADGVVSSIVSAADAKALEYSGIPGPEDKAEGEGSGLTATPAEATGAVLNDAMIAPIWRQGQTGNGDWLPGTDKMFRASTTSWQEVKDGYDAKDKRNDYNAAVNEVKKDKNVGSQYEAIKGQQYNRSGMGVMAAVMMVIVAVIRVPAEALMTLGVLVIRFIPILGPLFALLAIPAVTRSAATAAVKVVGASLFNVTVFGVVAAVHTTLIAILYVDTSNLFVSTLLSALATYILWKLSKPFRSVTRLATGQAVAQELQDVTSAPGNLAKKGLGYLTGTNTDQDRKPYATEEPGSQGLKGQPKIVVPEQGHPGPEGGRDESPQSYPQPQQHPYTQPQGRYEPMALEMDPAGSEEYGNHGDMAPAAASTVDPERSSYEGEIIDVDVEVDDRSNGGSGFVDGPEMHRDWTRRPRLATAWQREPLGLHGAPQSMEGQTAGEGAGYVISGDGETRSLTPEQDNQSDSMGDIYVPRGRANPEPQRWQPEQSDELTEPEFIGGSMVSNIFVPPAKEEKTVVVAADAIRPEAI